MSRIAKADVNHALQLAADTIVKAGGKDGRTSRAEMKAALATLPPAQKQLVDIFFKFVDARDFKAGAQVTAKDVGRAVTYAKEHLVAKYDLNNNGLSAAEIKKMSLTGKSAVDLARALKNAAGPLSVADFGKAINAVNKDVTYTSESDYQPVPIAGKPANGSGVTPENVKAAFGDSLIKFFKDGGDADRISSTAQMAVVVASPADTKSFLDDLAVSSDPTDDYSNKNAAGFAAIRTLLNDNLTDVRMVRVGWNDPATGKPESDEGLYSVMLIGKAKDGQLAGVSFGSVET